MSKRTWAMGRSLEAQTEKYDYYIRAMCPKCGAEPDEWCTTSTGLVCFEPHKRRIEHARSTVPVSEWDSKYDPVEFVRDEPDGVPIYVTVNTTFNVFKVTGICTHVYEYEHRDKHEGEVHTHWVIAKDFNGAIYWFNDAFNTHGDIHDIVSIEHVNCSEHLALHIEGYADV